jgi:6-phosphogluconolactonase
MRRAIAVALVCNAFGGAAGEATAAPSGAVYTLTNDSAGNAVQVFGRAGDGSLTPGGQFATGGSGTGAGLGSQGAIALDDRWLFAVNAGSDSISSLAVKGDALELVDSVPSGGDRPISVTVHDGLLYVLNAGGAGNITGFTVSHGGQLAPLAGSSLPLTGAATDPPQVSFDPTGRLLVVTEKATNLVDLYSVDAGTGLASGPSPQPSAGQTPFGFGFDKRGHLIVSEAFGGAVDQSAVSSYEVDGSTIAPITASAPTTETAACWIVVTKDGRFAYTTNTGSGSISGYRVSRVGALTLLDADGRTGLTGPGPIDMALSTSSRFLYALNAGNGTISGFRVGADGGLTPVEGAGDLPAAATGLAAS